MDRQCSYFLIYLHIGREFFEVEAGGLKELAPYVRVPETYMLGEIQDDVFLFRWNGLNQEKAIKEN